MKLNLLLTVKKVHMDFKIKKTTKHSFFYIAAYLNGIKFI